LNKYLSAEFIGFSCYQICHCCSSRWHTNNAQYVRDECAKSLKRLGLDYVDLYYMHRIDNNVPIEETMDALKELVEARKIKYIGLSECSSDTLR